MAEHKGKRNALFPFDAHDKAYFQAMISYIAEEHYIDDVSWLDFARAVVSAKMPAEEYIYEEFEKLFLFDPKNDFFEFYAKIWILSKYGNADHLLSTIKNSFNVWATEETLGRLVGGLAPIFRQDKMTDDLKTIVEGANNKSALEILRFHELLRQDATAYKTMRSYLTNRNPSLPLKISHPKFLMLLSVLQGFAISEEERAKLIKLHHTAFLDGFYSQRLTPLI